MLITKEELRGMLRNKISKLDRDVSMFSASAFMQTETKDDVHELIRGWGEVIDRMHELVDASDMPSKKEDNSYEN